MRIVGNLLCGFSEDFPFDETILAFRVLGKIFAMIDLDNIKRSHMEVLGIQ